MTDNARKIFEILGLKERDVFEIGNGKKYMLLPLNYKELATEFNANCIKELYHLTNDVLIPKRVKEGY